MPSNKKLLQAAAGNAGGDNLYVEDVFSTYLYAGNDNVAFDITNNIDLSGEGGMVWIKVRNASYDHNVFDTERGANEWLETNTTLGQQTATNKVDAFNADGFSLGTNTLVNGGTDKDYASWTFRKAEKFFDVVTYTGTGSERTVSHNLGAVPRIMIIKKTNGTGGWWVYSKDWVDANSGSLGVALNLSNADAGLTGYDTDFFWGANPTDSVFSVGTYNGTNGNTDTFVAYLFASDAGGFGEDETESIIKCGSYTGNGNIVGPVVDTGFEPQWVLIKSTATGIWSIFDNMRGIASGVSQDKVLTANANTAEYNEGAIGLTATGFNIEGTTHSDQNANGQTYIYIAIRRPMKTPESGTEVFAATTQQATYPNWVTGFPVDWMFYKNIDNASGDWFTGSRLIGTDRGRLNTTDAFSASSLMQWDYMNGQGEWSTTADSTAYTWNFKRATGFFDVVAYTGTGATSGSPNTHNHNLVVAPELIICKNRTTAGSNWFVYVSALGENKGLLLNLNLAELGYNIGFKNIGASTFQTFDSNDTNSANFIAYLFATLAGVSKVGSYTGTGSDLNVDCGFSAGARFILIKRTDSTGDWYVYDSARGIVVGNDPYLLLNSTAAEVTNTDYIDPLSSGFTVTSSAPAGLNASGGSYIFLAIA